MTSEQHQRLQDALKRQKECLRLKTWQNNALLQDCLAALDVYKILSSAEEAALLQPLLPLSAIPPSHGIPPLRPDGCYLILWDTADTPVIQAVGAAISAHFTEVTAVAFETVLLDRTTGACFRCKN